MSSPRISLRLRDMMFIAALLIAQAHAAATEPAPLKVTGVIQYVEGLATRAEPSGETAELDYQSPVYENDEITSSNVVKVVLRNGCLIAARGATKITVARPLKIKGPSIRVVCSDHARPELFNLNDDAVSMANGELLALKDSRVLLVNGQARVGRTALPLRKLVKLEKGVATPVDLSEADLRELNLSEKPPRESFVWPAPARTYSTRVMFGPSFEFEHALFIVKEYNQNKLRGVGPRLQFQFKTHDDHAFIVMLEQNETEDPALRTSPDSPPIAGANSRFERYLLEIGRRSSFDRWWSPYWRVGLGFVKAKVAYDDFNFGSSRYDYEFYAVSAAYGLDAHLSPSFIKPFGVYVGAEGQVIQSVFRGARFNEDVGYYQSPKLPREPWSLTLLNAGFNAGLELYF